MIDSFGVALIAFLAILVVASIAWQAPKEHDATTSHREHFILHGPSHVLERYKSLHSDEVLRDTFLSSGGNERKYLVGYYSCPLQAGNRLHHFINAYIWAIATNRTLLWKYYDKATCLALGTHHDQSICAAANNEQDCAQVLIRSDWIPSFDHWTTKLNLGEPTKVPYTKTKIELQWRLKLNQTESVDESSIDTMTDKLIDIGQLLGRDADVIGNKQGRDQLLQTEQSKMAIEALFSKGQRFLYGMLLDDAFQFHESVRPSLLTLEAISATATIALHSRHTSLFNEGNNTEKEQQCLLQVMKNISRPCTVILLSDRPATLSALSDFVIHRLNCTPRTATHDTGMSFRKDHGPFSGSGFFQDLALASHAIHGFIGHKQRSSSMLLEEMIVYKRSQHTELTTPLVECYLPKH